MSSQEFGLLALQLAAMLACAALCGGIMRKLGQPAVLGEMIGGILLGPTIFGALAPGLYVGLFQSSPGISLVTTLLSAPMIKLLLAKPALSVVAQGEA